MIEKLEKTKNEFEKRQSRKIEAYERDKQQRRTIMKIKSESSNKLREKIEKDSNIKIETSKKEINKKSRKKRRPKTAKKLETNIDINKEDTTNKYKILDIPRIKDEALTEDKIKSLVDDYRSKVLKSFLLFCNKEKEAENERKEIFEEAKTEKEKKRLQNIIKMQNAQSADKIGEFNNLIDKRITEYENALNEYYLRQKNQK